ncbi:MAG: glycosyltransferase family 39 protein [Acidobacteria bacterium]|nr:glycosyltransferase family 39 protein [Acidobacteriota bacterium]
MESTPIPNEAWFADPALNLLQHGHLGTSILSSEGTWLAGIDRHTYWVMPLHLVLQAAWYKAFGFNLLTLRLLSFFCGLGLIAAWYVILREIPGTARAAPVCVFLLALDYQFLRSATFGRMEALCALLGSGGLAVFLLLNARHPGWARLAAHALAALGLLAHPSAFVYTLDLLVLEFFLSGWRPTPRAMIATLVPYLVAGACLLTWASADWPSFLSQLGGNISGFAGEYEGARRFSGLLHPWTALSAELNRRYLQSYPPWAGLAVLWAYAAGIVWILARAPLWKDRGVRLVLILFATHFCFFWLFDGLKLSNYLIHLLPLIVALATISGFDFVAGRRSLAAALLLALVFLQASAVRHEIRRSNLREDYQPVVQLLRRYPGRSIAGPAELAFALGFSGLLQDDVRMGCYSGRRPDIYITSHWQRRWLQRARQSEPAAAACVQNQLDAGFHRIFRSPDYEVWLRGRP